MINENMELKEVIPRLPNGFLKQWKESAEDVEQQINLPGLKEISLQHPERGIAFFVIAICILSALFAFIR